MSLVNRLMANIQIVDESRCWEWTGAKWRTGYGCLTVNKRAKRVHRLSYEVHFGAIPSGMYVCHRCDNRSCINPDHLFLGTPADNTRDMIDKGRQRGQPPGSAHTRSKLTDSDVIAIRAAEGIAQKILAEQYGVDQSQISHIRSGKNWGHLKTLGTRK